MNAVDHFTGKPLDRPSDALPALNGQLCDDCGAECINRCGRCGAPQCCPVCCARDADVAERLADANRWLDTARPIIRAYFKLDDLDFEIGREMPPGPANTRTADEARRYVRTARRELHEMLDGIRSDFLADNEPPQPRPGASDQEWEERDNISDALAAETLSVADAIKRVEREWNDDFSKGGRP